MTSDILDDAVRTEYLKRRRSDYMQDREAAKMYRKGGRALAIEEWEDIADWITDVLDRERDALIAEIKCELAAQKPQEKVHDE